MSEEQKQVQINFYDQKYADTRRVIHRLEHPIFRYYDERLHRFARMPEKIGKILDLGCGQGGDAILLADIADHVTGIDISAEGIEVAKRLARDNFKKTNIDFLAIQGEHLPFEDNSFDVVYCKDALHHVNDPPQVMREAYRVLKPGGRFVAIEANPFSPQMAMIGLVFYSVDKGVFSNTRKHLEGLLNGCGLKGVECIRTEYFPRAIAFYYISPLNKIRMLTHGDKKYEGFEKVMETIGIFKLFSNYLVLSGTK